MAQTRARLPTTPRWSLEETRVLYNRWSAAKNRAKAKDQEFPWGQFGDFFKVVLDEAPVDYTPNTYRIEWGEQGYDYRPEAMAFVKKGPEDPCAFSVELILLLTTTSGSLEELVKLAAARSEQ